MAYVQTRLEVRPALRTMQQPPLHSGLQSHNSVVGRDRRRSPPDPLQLPGRSGVGQRKRPLDGDLGRLWAVRFRRASPITHVGSPCISCKSKRNLTLACTRFRATGHYQTGQNMALSLDTIKESARSLRFHNVMSATPSLRAMALMEFAPERFVLPPAILSPQIRRPRWRSCPIP
jgi:hypothetical protein